MRGRVGAWMLSNGATRFYDTDRAVQAVRDTLPVYDSAGGLTSYGRFGGSMEYTAVADLTGCVIFTYSEGDVGDATGWRYEPGVCDGHGTRGRRRSSTLSATLEHCAFARERLMVFRFSPPNHWHAMLPVGDAGEVLAAPHSTA